MYLSIFLIYFFIQSNILFDRCLKIYRRWFLKSKPLENNFKNYNTRSNVYLTFLYMYYILELDD